MAIVTTSTGFRHTADKGFYSGAIAESGVVPTNGVKRGRGRPRKYAGDAGTGYDFSQLMPAVKVPEFTGKSRIVLKLADDE